MRLALLSDVHGNSVALDAVLADASSLGDVDAYWVLGDLCAIGHDPVGVLERLTALPNVAFIRGNTDRFVVSGELPTVPNDDKGIAEMVEGFKWTRAQVSRAGWFDWLTALQLERRMSLPDGTRLLAVHASPGEDAGPGITMHQPEEEAWTLLQGCEADLVVIGHTHTLVDRNVRGIRVFNPGAVSLPPSSDLRAKYAVLESDTSGYELVRRFVDYDRKAAVDALDASGFPAAEYVAAIIRGEQQT